jgi:simple sugar transport system substrate-binding protein
MKISRRASLTMLATLAAATLIGCGKKEEPAAAAPAAAPAAAAPAADPLKVAFVYIGPVGDAGWTFAHDKGRKAVEEKVRRQGQDHLRGKHS